jgi:hypothetical protein
MDAETAAWIAASNTARPGRGRVETEGLEHLRSTLRNASTVAQSQPERGATEVNRGAW